MTDYNLLNDLFKSFIFDSKYIISNLSNASAFLNENLDDINWVGFYLVEGSDLILGPFQGKVACTNIKRGNGVCGTAFLNDSTIVVKNVHEFKTHIACDKASNSEIVIPIHLNGEVYGVLDIDSPILNRFSNQDKEGLENFVKIIEEMLKVSK